MFGPGGPTLRELAAQALSSTDRGYDLLAPKFDKTPFRTPPELLEAARPLLAEARPERGLDLCCGTGAGLELLATVCGQPPIGLDRSAGMLEVARWADPGGRHRLVRGDALAPPFGGQLDVVTCFGALGHFLPEQHEALVDAVFGLLRPGGAFVFPVATPPGPLSPGFWLAHGFDGAMRVRNALRKPAFVMYYLALLLPRAQQLLERRGFSVEVHAPKLPPRLRRLRLVRAIRG